MEPNPIDPGEQLRRALGMPEGSTLSATKTATEEATLLPASNVTPLPPTPSLPPVPQVKKTGGFLIKVLVILLGILGFSLAVVLTLYLLEPSSQVKDLNLSNTTDSQVTVSWTTTIPTRGAILISDQSEFPLLPLLVNSWQKDDGEKKLGRARFYTNHHITITNLTEGQAYQYIIYQGLRKVYQGSFKSGVIPVSITGPDPVYGRILKGDRTPAVGAIVYLWVNGGGQSSVISTLTNSEGRWSLDLSNLRDKSQAQVFQLDQSSVEWLVAEFNGKKVQYSVLIGRDKPWPDLIIK